MLKRQFEEIRYATESEPTVSIDEIGKANRTLIYGYTCKRQTFHVYVKYGEIYRVIFDGPEEFVTSGAELEAWTLVPDKRVYPEWCDYEFCKLLQSKGVDIPFLNFNDDADEVERKVKYGNYYGETLV